MNNPTPRSTVGEVMKRRTFIGSLGAASAVTLAGAQSAGRPSRELTADVLVIGGGTAGTIAALQAGRLGVRTVLVEAGSQLGGTTTTAGVDFPGLFHAWGKQVIGGIGWELVTAAVELNGDELPDFTIPTGRQHWRHQVRVSGPLYAALAEEACLQAGVQLRYYESPASIVAADQGWRVRLVGKGTDVTIVTKQLIDCTGNAAAVELAGLPRVRESITQPGTLIYRLGGWEPNEVEVPLLQRLHDAALQAGELQLTDMRGNVAGFLRNGGENAMHVSGADSSTSVLHTSANIAGRQSLLRVMRFLKKDPAFAFLRVERLQAETGVRETFRVSGEKTVTVRDYRSGRVFDDSVAYSFYPIDLHVDGSIVPQHLDEGVVPTIPLGALIPRRSRNLLVAGRCISSDRLANSALRVQASCMAMGQAAGATAALSANQGASPREVPLREIHAALARHGAILPGKT